MSSIAINVRGGTGKNFSLAHILPEIKEKYDNVYVRSPYFDIFQSSKYVDYVYKGDEARDFIFDNKDAVIINDNMYETDAFIKKRVSYADAWRIMLGLEQKGNKNGSDTKSNITPEIPFPFLVQQKDAIMKEVLKNHNRFILVQFWGGQSPLIQPPMDEKGQPDWGKVAYNYNNEPLKRIYPIEKAQEFINLFKEAHPDTAIIHYALPNEPGLDGCFRFTQPYLVYHLLARAPECIGAVTIDSSLQHMIAGLCKTLVIWGHSTPESFGYEYNKNILQRCNRDEILYFTELGASGARVDYIQPEKLLEETNGYLF